jgi:hypothetical protein
VASGVRLALGVVAAVLVAGCAASSLETAIHVRDLPDRPSYDPAWIVSDRAAAAVAMAVMDDQLRLPRLDVTLHFYPTRAAFQGALLSSGYDPAFAQQTASRMDAIGGYRRVLLNDEVLSRLEGPAKAALLAHELTHSLQYELGGGIRGASPQWLREGMADWVAARVLAALDVQSLDEFKRRRLAAYRAGNGPGPPLASMGTFQEWVGLVAKADTQTTVAKAFLAADFLIEQRSLNAVLDYFRRFAVSQDAAANFSRAFGETPIAFEAALDEHLRRLR